MRYDQIIQGELEDQLNFNLGEIHKYAGFHPEEEPNPVLKFIKRVRGKIFRHQTLFNQNTERAMIDIFQLQNRIYQFSAAMYETKDDAFYHRFCISKERRIVQLTSAMRYGDAVGNDVLAIQNALKAAGFVTATFAEQVDQRIPKGTVYPAMVMPELKEDDIVLYHFAAQDHMEKLIRSVPATVVLRYHNVTPPQFFEGYDTTAMLVTQQGLAEIENLKDAIDYGMVVSEFNRDNLREMGYTCPMEVAPILIPFEDYRKTPNAKVISKYDDTRTNILFVGRMAPNKKVEDVISAFAEYKKSYDRDARLFLVGSYNESDLYYQSLCSHIKRLGVEDVIFPGHIGFDEILAYYSLADLFLLMSEHEGFCVPLVEAMLFDVPIVAYDSCAVPNTLGGSGHLVKEKDFSKIAGEMKGILSDDAKRESIKQSQRKRLADFDNQVIGEQIVGFMKNL